MIDNLTTVLITTSPSPKHPSTDLIEETIDSVRWHLPTAEILILCDGVRPEQEHHRAAYSEFVIRLETLSLERWKNVRLIVFPEWQHQAWTIAKGIEQVKTPLILFTEHDQALLPIWFPWGDVCAVMNARREVNVIRFMLEDSIKPEWEQFMLGPLQKYSTLTKTIQWSQRTHLAFVDYYRKMIDAHLKPDDRCYLEDRLYGQCDDWEENRLTIYTPHGPMARIRHLDGRGDDVKFHSVLEGKE
jgi:hypothetical protein